MQSLPKNSKVDDTDSLFNFLDEGRVEPDNTSAHNTSQSEQKNQPNEGSAEVDSGRQDVSAENPFPVIRKPVSVRKSGALKAPAAGERVEPPPPLTKGERFSTRTPAESAPLDPLDTPSFDDLDKIFQDEEEDWPSSEAWVDDAPRPYVNQYHEPQSSWGRKAAYAVAALFILAGSAAILHGVPQVRDWSQSKVAMMSDLVAPMLNRDKVTNQEPVTSDSTTGFSVSENTANPTENSASISTTSGDTGSDAQKSLNTLFNEELAAIELLVEQGDFDGVDAALKTMDPFVFGYGSIEFTEIQSQVAALRDPSSATGEENDIAREPLAQDDLGALEEPIDRESSLEEARLAEQQRIVQEQAELAEAARQAELEAQEEALAKAEEARRLEQQQQAAEAEQLRADRIAQEKARAEQFRLALEERARNEQRLAEQRLEQERLEALRLEEQRLEELRTEVQRLEEQRLEELRLAEQRQEVQRQEEQRVQEQQLADQLAEEQRVLEQEQRQAQQLAEEQRLDELDRDERRRLVGEAAELSTVAPSVEEIAARQQREATRLQQLEETRQREAQQESVEVDRIVTIPATSDEDLALALAESSLQQGSSEGTIRAIADSELQQVYRQFAELESAIENRDINAVVNLTESSSVRIQQVLQVFENNVSIEAQLRNVSTLDAAGEIRGTIEITRLERVDGSVTGPPRNFDSIPILSVRNGDGWSQIRW